MTRIGRTPLGASVLLLVAYLALSALLDPNGYLGTDTGAKVATLEAMERAGSTRPDVGYWAEEWDPEGAVHPLYQSKRSDDGAWVAVTTLPMLELAHPLYDLGGYRLALLVPMLGGVACALGARRLARSLASPEGDLVFWVVGLSSPILIYSLDFWEHVVGAAAIVWAVALLVEAVHARQRWWHGFAAGALLGFAATMRTEALVYTLVVVAVACLTLVARSRSIVEALRLGVGAVVGFGALWAGNVALERSVGGLSRSSRASDTASGTAEKVSGQVGERLQEALVTTLGVKGDTTASWCIGAGIVLVLVLAWRAHRRGDRTMATACVVLAGLVYFVSALSDLGFVPGMVPAFPLVAGLALLRPSGPARTALLVAVAALPLVWAFQYLGAAGPQWGGRYILPSSIVLGTVALVGLAAQAEARRALVALGASVTLIGVAWIAVRTRSVHDAFDDLRAVDADVLVVRDAFFLREGGPVVLDERWLTAAGEDQFQVALEVAADSSAATVAVVELGATEPPAGVVPDDWTEVGRGTTDLAGDRMGIVVYEVPTAG